jgi:hypothetical protein
MSYISRKKPITNIILSLSDYSNYTSNVKSKKKKKLLKNDFTILKYKEYNKIMEYDFKVNQLKEICKHYNQKQSGNKNQITNRVYDYLRLSYFAGFIQRVWRGFLYRQYIKIHGPGFYKRKLCTNATDFFSMDPIENIVYPQFFSYKDKNNKIYGFDIISFYNLIRKKNTLHPQNPYTRDIIPEIALKNFKYQLRLSKILNISITTEINKEDISFQKKLDMEILELFQKIDNLGNYTNTEWFTILTRSQLIRYLRELNDIWVYRAELSQDVKRDICPPRGDPFMNTDMNIIVNISYEALQKLIINIMKKLVNTGINRDSQTLGAYYVLAGLTLVNEDAANAMPWLYQSVIQIQ